MGVFARFTTGIIDAVYPPRCVACENATETPLGLCGDCWRDTHFFAGAVCDVCGVSVPTADGTETPVVCDSCTHAPPAWDRGRSAVAYEGAGRRVVLSFKHGDRLDMSKVLGRWLCSAAAPLLTEQTVIIPVPLHWRRLWQRRYNQSAELARFLARETGAHCIMDALIRNRHTQPQLGSRSERHDALRDAISLNPARAASVAGLDVLLIDDVLTSGATLSACAEALRPAAPKNINVAVIARVARDT